MKGSRMMIKNSVPHRLQWSLIRPAVAVLAICICLFACTQADQPPAGPAEKITIAFANPPYTVLADVAQMQGYFLQEGLESSPQFHSSGKATLAAVLEGKADFATTAETPVMFAIMKGEKIAVIATIQTSNKNHAIVARKDKGVLTLNDLKGRKIASTFGTNADFFLDAYLSVHGITRKNMEVVDLKPGELQNALVNGDVDAVSVFQPFLIQAQKKLDDRGVTFYDEDIYSQTFNLVATQEFISKNPETVKKLLRALVKAEEFVRKNPAEAQKIVSASRKIDIDLIGEIWDGNNFSVSLDQSLVLALEDESRWAIQGGLTKETKVPNYLDYIYIDGLSSVKPEAVRILR